MKSREALRVLAEVSESQWGMVTSAQANVRGVSHMNLTRLTDSGDIVRLSHGVYRDAGAPGGEHDELRAAWLSSESSRLAWDRLQDQPCKVIVSGESAATVHGIGNLRNMRSEFTTPFRKQTQRPDVHYRTRTLTSDDVTVREGLPVTTLERTIADLVEQRTQLDHVGDVLRDAARKSRLDTDRLALLLAPLAERNGHSKGDGSALLEELLETARIDQHSLSQEIVKMPDFGALVVRDYLAANDISTVFDGPAFQSILKVQSQQFANLSEVLRKAVLPTIPTFDRLAESMAAATAAFDNPALKATLKAQAEQIAAMSAALGKLWEPSLTDMSSSVSNRLSEAISVADWASLAQRAQLIAATDDEEAES